MYGAGFIFWGLFLVFALIVVAYIIWMVHVERADSGEDTPRASPPTRTHPDP